LSPAPPATKPLVSLHLHEPMHNKPRRSFYRAANSAFGKVVRVASEEVTIQQ